MLPEQRKGKNKMKYALLGCAVSAIATTPASLSICGGMEIPFEVSFWSSVIGNALACLLFVVYFVKGE